MSKAPAPILMIHGVGCTGSAWATFAQALGARGHACEAPTLAADRRLRSNPPAALLDVTLQDHVDEAAGWARAMAAEHGRLPVVAGHSMGGLIAQKLAEAGLAEAAVLVTPAAPAQIPAKPSLGQAFTFANIVFAGDPTDKAHKIWRTGFEWGVLNRTPKARHAAIYAEAVFESGQVYAGLSGPPATALRQAALVDPARVTIPVLAIGAKHDRVTPPASVRRIAEFYGVGAAYREYAVHGHWIVDEPGAADVAHDIADWLASA